MAAAPACSNTITVTNNSDTGPGSLRQAIVDVCSGGTIYFDHDMTVTLASELVIDKPLTIEGQERRVTISGNKATRVFLIQNVYTGVYLNRLTIANGWAGNDNGGGIKNVNSSLWLDSCLLTGNVTQASGGAIYDNYYLVVRNSTLTGNTAGSTGGAIFSDSQSASLMLNNVTITHNSASYAGGVSNAGANWAAAVNNTIIAGQTTGVNCDMWSATGSGNNLSNTSSCSGGFTKSDAILLGSLGDYGGVTRSIPLLPGSLAIDGGRYCAGGGFDQRGFPRVGTCDIGAFESQGFTITPASGNNESATINTSFPVALLAAVAPKQPGEPVDGGLVIFTPPASGATASLTGSPATIGGGSASVSASANGQCGTYGVTASTRGAAADATFTLTNTDATAVRLSGLHGEAATPGWIWTVAAFAGALALTGLALGCIARARRA